MQSPSSTSRDPQQLLDSISDQVAALIRQEVSDAYNSITRRAPAAGKGLGLGAAGGLLLYVSFLVAMASLVEMLTAFMPRWLAALLVSGGLAAGGAVFLQQGMERLNQAGVGPQQLGQVSDAVDDSRRWVERQTS